MGCLLAAVGGIWWLLNYTDSPNARRASDEEPPVVADKVSRFVVREDGKPAWELTAGRIEISPDNRYATAVDLKEGILYRDGKRFLRLTAKRVKLDQHFRDLEATGAVRATGADGFSAQSERINWKQAKRTLTCPGSARITLRGMNFQSRGLVYDMAAGKLTCPQSVQAQGAHASMQGPRAMVDAKARTVEMPGPVRIKINPRGAPPQLAPPSPVPAPGMAPAAAPSPTKSSPALN